MKEWVDNWPRYKAERDNMKESRDCCVVSFCEIWGAPYNLAHEHIKKQFGRKNRKGTPTVNCRDAIARCPKTKMAKREWEGKDRPTIKKFCEMHPEGKYWVFVAGHALAIIDGVVYDHTYGPRRKVKFAFRVYV
ncbi:putative peptidase [Pseudomonas phage 16Q]|nr:putative peptidase [Pseudomonas phage 16Q]